MLDKKSKATEFSEKLDPFSAALFQLFHSDLRTAITYPHPALVEIKNISGIKAKSSLRGSYRILYEDGSVVKARGLSSTALAQRIQYVNQQIPPGLLSPIFFRQGCVVLEQWVEGTPLHKKHLTHAEGLRAGRLLGQIHSTQAQATSEYSGHSIHARADQLQVSLETLSTQRAISKQQAVEAAELARSTQPHQTEYGFIHSDLAPENIVCTDSELVAIDNGGLSFDALDFDLARTWYRWPLTNDCFQSFLQGYQFFRSIDSFQHGFPFWAISVLCRAAIFHLRELTKREQYPIRRLQTLLQSYRTTKCQTPLNAGIRLNA